MRMTGEKYINFVVNELLKGTTVEIYGNIPYFYTPTGIIHRNGDVYMYDDTIQKKYGIPEDLHNTIEQKYKDILLDLEYDIGYTLPKPKWDESVYDFLKRVRRPINESLKGKLDNYHNYIVDDIIKNLKFDVVDAVSKVYVRVTLPFRAPSTHDLDIYITNTNLTSKNIVFGQFLNMRYGVNKKSEMVRIWFLFVDKYIPFVKQKMRELLAPYGYK
jgi:hypothetical protein